MLRLRTLGGLAIENGGVHGDAAFGRRPLALLALLAVAGQRGLSREKAASLLWPESDEEHGRNSLSQALSALRRGTATGETNLVVGNGELRLNPDLITSDLEEFEARLAAGDLEGGVRLYHGPFLDGFFLKGAAEFERLVEEHRRRLHQSHGFALERLAKQADERGDYAAAIAWWRRLAALDPVSATPALGLMNAFSASGDRAGALQHYRVHQEVLRQELGVEPEAAVASLAASMRHENTVPALPERSPTNGHASFIGSDSPAMPVADASSDRDDSSAGRDSGVERVNSSSTHAVRVARVARWLAVPALVSLAAIAFTALRPDRRPQYNPRQVVVTGFANRTGDSTLNAFGFLAADYITDALQRSGLVEVTDPVTSLSTVTGVRDSAARTDEAKEMQLVAAATRAGLVVSGHYSRVGDSIVVVARVSDAEKGSLVAATDPVRAGATNPTDALEHVRQRVLGILAVRLDNRLADVLTPGSTPPPTLAAYREYVDGLMRFQRLEYPIALAHFQRASQLDSTFIAPLVWKIFVFSNTSKPDEQRDATEALTRRRGQLTPLDGHVLEFFEAKSPRDMPAQARALQQATDLAPGSIWAYNLGWALYQLGRYQEAVAALEQIDRKFGWTRNWAGFWGFLVASLHYVGDYQRELEMTREARRALPPDVSRLMDEARALAALGRKSEARKVIAEMRNFPDPRHCYGNYLRLLGNEFWSRGDTVYAQQVLDSAVTWIRGLPATDQERCSLRWQLAFTLYDAGHWAEALPLFQRAVAEIPTYYQAVSAVGRCYGHLGDRAKAEESISRLVVLADSDDRALTFAAQVAAVLGDRERVNRFLKEYRDRGHAQLLLDQRPRDFSALKGFVAHKNFGGLIPDAPPP